MSATLASGQGLTAATTRLQSIWVLSVFVLAALALAGLYLALGAYTRRPAPITWTAKPAAR